MRLLCLELLIRFNNKLCWGDTEFCVNTFVVDSLTGSSPYAIIVGCILFLSSWNIYAILLTAFFFWLLILIGLSMTGIPKWLKVIPCHLYSVQIELQQNVGRFYFIPFHFHIHVKWKKYIHTTQKYSCDVVFIQSFDTTRHVMNANAPNWATTAEKKTFAFL